MQQYGRLWGEGMNRCQIIFSYVMLFLLLSSSALRAENKLENRVVPLPKEMSVSEVVTVDCARITITQSGDFTTVIEDAVSRFKNHVNNGGTLSGTQTFEIALCLADEKSGGNSETTAMTSRLKKLPNKRQAYCIKPSGKSKLTVCTLDRRGMIFAMQTLRDLIAIDKNNGTAAIPLVTITDWPDMEYRGIWDDTFPREQLDLMATLKLNLVDCHSGLRVEKDGRGTVYRIPRKGEDTIDSLPYGEYCRRLGIEFVPIITHFSHLARTGIYEVYPQLVGIGEPEDKRFIPPCAKRPEFVNVIADWLEALLSEPYVEEISIWLSEVEQQCQCPDCLAAGQYVMETRAIIKAWNRVKSAHPGKRLRILTTQGSYATNDKVLKELPVDIGVVYYDGERSYDSSREPMMTFDFAEHAAGGFRTGVCPQITVSWALVIPWSSPQFIRTRMNEYVDKELSILSAYATPDFTLYDFNTEAMAEWSWNAKGRSEREFALAWATRKGYDDPEAVADWAVIHGDLSWNIYGSKIPFEFIEGFGHAQRMIKHHVRPILGEGMFRYYRSPADFERDLDRCEEALAIARGIGDMEIIEETKIARGYIMIARELYSIASFLADHAGARDRERIAENMASMSGAVLDTGESLRRWEELHGTGSGGGRFLGTINLMEDFTLLVQKELTKLGIDNPLKDYFPREIGTWSMSDLKQGETTRIQWAIGQLGRGAIEVCFKGNNGMDRGKVSRAALLAPDDGPSSKLKKVAKDSHEGRTDSDAYRNGNVFTLEPPRLPRDAYCHIEAWLTPEGSKESGGVVWIRHKR